MNSPVQPEVHTSRSLHLASNLGISEQIAPCRGTSIPQAHHYFSVPREHRPPTRGPRGLPQPPTSTAPSFNPTGRRYAARVPALTPLAERCTAPSHLAPGCRSIVARHSLLVLQHQLGPAGRWAPAVAPRPRDGAPSPDCAGKPARSISLYKPPLAAHLGLHKVLGASGLLPHAPGRLTAAPALRLSQTPRFLRTDRRFAVRTSTQRSSQPGQRRCCSPPDHATDAPSPTVRKDPNIAQAPPDRSVPWPGSSATIISPPPPVQGCGDGMPPTSGPPVPHQREPACCFQAQGGPPVSRPLAPAVPLRCFQVGRSSRRGPEQVTAAPRTPQLQMMQ